MTAKRVEGKKKLTYAVLQIGYKIPFKHPLFSEHSLQPHKSWLSTEDVKLVTLLTREKSRHKSGSLVTCLNTTISAVQLGGKSVFETVLYPRFGMMMLIKW
jgi:hypothetical protein